MVFAATSFKRVPFHSIVILAKVLMITACILNMRTVQDNTDCGSSDRGSAVAHSSIAPYQNEFAHNAVSFPTIRLAHAG